MADRVEAGDRGFARAIRQRRMLGAGLHQLQNGRWVKITEIKDAFTVVPALVVIGATR